MSPNKDEQPRRGNEPRGTAEPRTSNTQGNSNAVSQPTNQQQAQGQSSARQSSNMASQNNAQRPSQQPAPGNNSTSYRDALQNNNRNQPQHSDEALPAAVQSSARQRAYETNQNMAQRPSQQPATGINSTSYRDAVRVQGHRNLSQRSGEAPPAPARSSTRHNFTTGNQDYTQRPRQQPEPKGVPASRGTVAGDNVRRPLHFDETPHNSSAAVTGDRSRTTRASLPASNQPNPPKTLFPKYQGSASEETDTSNAAGTSKVANRSNDVDETKGANAPKIYGGHNGTFPKPDEGVNKAEDDFIKPDFIPTQHGSGFCVHPAYGSWGTPAVLWTNYLELKLPSNGVRFYSYNITVEPEIKTDNPDHDNKPEGDKKRIPKGEKRRQLIKVFLDDPIFKAEGSATVATDFYMTLITRRALVLGKGKLGDPEGNFTVEYKAPGFASAAPERYSIQVKETAVLDVSDFIDDLNPNTNTSIYNKSLIEGAFNVILSYYTKQSDTLTRVGSRKIFPFSPALVQDKPDKLDNGLVALRGYFTGAIGATSRILVNVNICNGVFYDGVPLKDLIKQYRRGGKTSAELHRFLKRLRVKTIHLSAKDKAFGKIRTIYGLATNNDGVYRTWPPSIATAGPVGGDPYQVKSYEDSSTEFTTRSSPLDSQREEGSGRRPFSELSKDEQDRYITVSDFFKKAYPQVKAARHLEKNIPVVNVGTRAIPIYLPAEVCEVLPGQVSPSKLNGRQTSNMIAFAKCDPGECAKLIAQEGRRTLGYEPRSESMVGFEMETSRDLITVPSRILKTPKIEYKSGGSKQSSVSPREGSWNIDQLHFYTAAKIEQYYVWRIATGDERDGLPFEFLGNCLAKFSETMTQCGIKSAKSSNVSTISISEVEDRLRSFNKSTASGKFTPNNSASRPSDRQSKAKATPRIPLLVIILPSRNDEPYNTIKRLADRELGFHTICVIGEKDQKGNFKKFYAPNPEQYNANVMLKINLKFGGVNHKLAEESQAPGILGNGTTMIVGIDVTHPSPGSGEGAPSIFAVVTSQDRYLSQWPVRFGVQKKSREEVISNGPRLTTMFQELLKLWQAKNGKYPENIIIYRDGVSEGQYSAVIQQELTALREACNYYYLELPPMTLIVVAKRHHTRFYPTKSNHADSTHNAKCGTVVDRGITQARTWDFFLQSHSVIKGGVIKGGYDKKTETQKPSGTARPAHYVVLYDEVFAKYPKDSRADQLQQMTHNMCYLYGPATKAISICPPVYLADKACTRARLYLNDVFGPPSHDEIEKRKDKKDETDETPEEKEQREEDETNKLNGYQDMIKVHGNLKDTMFYI